MNQLELHKKIDLIVSTGVDRVSVDDVSKAISTNSDAKRYFFSIVDEAWVKWLLKEGLFDELRKPAVDKTQYAYRLPELEYLTRMSETDPQEVRDVIQATPISEDTFNPEVVDRFLWIIGLLPAEQIKDLLPKILREKWTMLMAPFNRSGYEYQKIVKKLESAGNFEALIELAQAILIVREKKEFDAIETYSISNKLFYLSDISDTGIFEAILHVDNEKTEAALKIFLEILAEVVRLGKNRDDEVFAESEPFYLRDVDIFNIKVNTTNKYRSKEDIENFVATCKELIEREFATACRSAEKAKRIYETYISKLPDSHTAYRLKLYAITRCPKFLKEELKESLFRVFTVGERYFEIDGGAEYHNALIAGFSALDDEVKREYVAKVIEYYGASLEDKDKESWRKRDGLEILTYIKRDLEDSEKTKIETIFGKFPEDGVLKPHPSIGPTTSGIVNSRSPVELRQYSVPEIVEHLKSDLSPAVLSEKYKHDDFFNPRGVEGVMDAIKEDFKTRPAEYFSLLNNFFDREAIDPSYICGILREVDEALRNKRPYTHEQYVSIFNLFEAIRVSGEREEFEKSEDKSWVPDWITVHKLMADITLNILADIKDSEVFNENKIQILSLISYLLTIKESPNAEDEKAEYGEPSHIAINSVRGEAFRALVQFTYDEGNLLTDEVKKIYERVIENDTSTAVRFVIGQFLASFYFRDIPYITNLLPKIFPKSEAGKENLYFGAWEGYLSSSLYKELFFALKDYYAYAIGIKSENYPDRKYLKGLDETLAAHLALAYAHFEFEAEDPLLISFWEAPNETRHFEFPSFLGRHYLSRDVVSDEWFAEAGVSKQKLIDFWDWMLKTDIALEPKAFAGFGFWVNPDKEVIPDEILVEKVAATLKKSNGEIDWDYGLLHRINKFATVNPEKTLEILRSLLLLNEGLNPNHRIYFEANTQLGEPLKIIYANDEFKASVESLINDLILRGSSTFWGLKEILL